MSSTSRSGSSSSACSGDRPEASKSNTSVTRMRNPRTQGRPPHWSGFTVIRSASAATVSSSTTGYTATQRHARRARDRHAHGQSRSLWTPSSVPERTFPTANQVSCQDSVLFGQMYAANAVGQTDDRVESLPDGVRNAIARARRHARRSSRFCRTTASPRRRVMSGSGRDLARKNWVRPAPNGPLPVPREAPRSPPVPRGTIGQTKADAEGRVLI